MNRKRKSTYISFRKLENQFPEQARAVFRRAAKRSENLGLEVVQIVDGELRRVKPDGTYEVIKKIVQPEKKFHQGQTLELA